MLDTLGSVLQLVAVAMLGGAGLWGWLATGKELNELDAAQRELDRLDADLARDTHRHDSGVYDYVQDDVNANGDAISARYLEGRKRVLDSVAEPASERAGAWDARRAVLRDKRDVLAKPALLAAAGLVLEFIGIVVSLF